jgi:hypothetical protein
MRGVAWLGGGVLGALLALSRGAAAAPTLAGETEAQKRERATLLSQSLPTAVYARGMPAVPPLLMSLGILEGALGVGYERPQLIISGSVLLAGTSAFYFVSERRNYELVAAMGCGGSSCLTSGLGGRASTAAVHSTERLSTVVVRSTERLSTAVAPSTTRPSTAAALCNMLV